MNTFCLSLLFLRSARVLLFLYRLLLVPQGGLLVRHPGEEADEERDESLERCVFVPDEAVEFVLFDEATRTLTVNDKASAGVFSL